MEDRRQAGRVADGTECRRCGLADQRVVGADRELAQAPDGRRIVLAVLVDQLELFAAGPGRQLDHVGGRVVEHREQRHVRSACGQFHGAPSDGWVRVGECLRDVVVGQRIAPVERPERGIPHRWREVVEGGADEHDVATMTRDDDVTSPSRRIVDR